MCEKNWEVGTDIYTLLTLIKINNENILYLPRDANECSVVTLNGKEIKNRGDICTCTAESLCCTAEA